MGAQGSSHRGPEKVQVQVPRSPEDLHLQEVGLHQVGQRRVRGHEGRGPPPARRCQRQVSAGAWAPLHLVQGPGPAGRSRALESRCCQKHCQCREYKKINTFKTKKKNPFKKKKKKKKKKKS